MLRVLKSKVNTEKIENGTLVYCWECRLVQPLWKTVWNFLRKLKMELTFDLAVPLLGLYPKNSETPIQKNLCTPMFRAVLFTVAKCWKQTKCPLINERIKQLWYNCTMEYYRAETKRELLPFMTAWTDLESMVEGKWRQLYLKKKKEEPPPKVSLT